MKYVASLLVVLLAIVELSSAVSVSCSSGDEFTVYVNSTDGLDDYYVRPQDAPSCNESVQLTGPPGGQSALITCFAYTVGVEFNVLFHEIDEITTGPADSTVVGLTCNAQESAVVTDFITVSLPPAQEEVTGIITADVSLSAFPSAASIGDTITLIFTVTGDNADEFVLGLESLLVSSPSADYYLVYDSCVLDSQVTTTVTGNATSVLTVTFPAFYYFGNNTIISPVVLKPVATIVFCHEDVGTAACIVDVDTGCDDTSLNSVRRRRQASVAQTKNLDTTVMVFMTQAEKEEYVAGILEQEGVSRQTQSDDDLCVNKTVSATVLVLLIVGMIICLLAAVWMFIKLRRARRLQSKLSTNPSVFGDSNRGFS